MPARSAVFGSGNAHGEGGGSCGIGTPYLLTKVRPLAEHRGAYDGLMRTSSTTVFRRLAALALAVPLMTVAIGCSTTSNEPAPLDPTEVTVEQDGILPPSNVPDSGEGLDEVEPGDDPSAGY